MMYQILNNIFLKTNSKQHKVEIVESNLTFSNLLNRQKTNHIIIHHSAHNTANVYDIDHWHKRKGWCGIGYHYFIEKNGSIYRGRPEKTIGAHAYAYNATSIGICLQGNFTTSSPSPEQIKILIALCDFLCKKYNHVDIIPHNLLNNTECPGINFPVEFFSNFMTNTK